ncbi:MAG: hypothetical protein H6500_01070 [Candidatus Woesearchaeota archaeon]|nr:hypothetical protein [Nanoarchaeota archaeon]USN44423.1 MAG: hypothetical protein H6500_01070 [Candidatus Woesearchaeota archaeon]
MTEETQAHFELNAETIVKLPLLLFYELRQGKTVFSLHLHYGASKKSLSHLCKTLKITLEVLFQKYPQIHIILTGIPPCLLERNLLTPQFLYATKGQVKTGKKKEDAELAKHEGCQFCWKNTLCSGFNKEYVHKFKEFEFLPIVRNEDYLSLYEEESKNFSEEMQKYCRIVFDDFRMEQEYMKKRISFVKSIPLEYDESCKERILYRICNPSTKEEEHFELLEKLCPDLLLAEFKSYISQCQECWVSLGKTSNHSIRKTIYVTIGHLDEKKRRDLEEKIGMSLSVNCYGIAIERKDEKFRVKTYEQCANLSKEEVCAFVKEFHSENKRKFLCFLNCVYHQKNLFSFERKFAADGSLIKKIGIRGELFSGKELVLSQIFKGSFPDSTKFVYDSLTFEFYHDKEEKVNLYYSPLHPLEQRVK